MLCGLVRVLLPCGSIEFISPSLMERRWPVQRSTVCKVVLLGDAGSGKTCLLRRFMNDTFDALTQPTVGAAFGTKTLATEQGPVSLQIWDTAGQERYQALANLYYRNANAAIICCDVTELQSFKRMEYWIKQVQRAEKSCKIYACGNKADLVWDGKKGRAVTLQDLEIFQTKVFETSSKMSYNVFQLFQLIADDLEHVESKSLPTSSKVEIDFVGQETNRKCCQS